MGGGGGFTGASREIRGEKQEIGQCVCNNLRGKLSFLRRHRDTSTVVADGQIYSPGSVF